MAEWKSRVGKLALVLLAPVIAGCPTALTPMLSATPGAVDFGTAQTTRNLSLTNTGGGTLTWSAQEVTRVDADAPWVPGEVPWLSLSVTEGTIEAELENVTLTATRGGLSAGLYTNTGVQITSNGGTTTIPVSLTVESAMSVTPLVFSLSANDTTASFSVLNNGFVPLNWTTAYLLDSADPESTVPFPAGFNLNPSGGTIQGQSSVAVTMTFPAGQESFAILVSSPSGNAILRFNVGASLENFIVSPATLRVYKTDDPEAEQSTSTLTLENRRTTPVSWTITLADQLDRNTAPALSATPVLGTTAVGATSQVQVRITDPAKIVADENRYELVVRSGDSFQVVPIVIDILPQAEIALAHAPDTNNIQPPVVPKSLLDFGVESIQEQFWVVNVGDADSQLFFDVIHEDEGSTNPLILSITPSRGNTNGPDQDYFLNDQELYADGVPITVTIDRSRLVEEVETRTITVRAFNSSFTERETSVASATIELRVEKQPFTITGADNRTRPPNILRFVLSNRNDLGQVVPLQTTTERERLAYDIFENELPLDLNETSQFVTYDYRGNVVLMLDYTGSMYNAGTAGEDPLRPGDAVELMRDAAETFIDDLPLNFNLQLMYFSDRAPESRIIQPFTNDRALLKSALRRFNLKPAQYGASDINEALVQAIESLVAEDPQDTLPLDDADLRAIVFISDGEDNVSGVAVSEVGSQADDALVRLFPVGYSPNGDPVNAADLITLAADSGGYLYSVGSVDDLDKALGTRGSVVLEPAASPGDNLAAFTIRNLGAQDLSYSVVEIEDTPWIVTVPEATGVIEGNRSLPINVRLSQGEAETGLRFQGKLAVSVGNDKGEVVVQFTSGTGGVARNVLTTVRDEPGTIWEEFNNQSVVTYISPKEENFTYLLSGRYLLPDNRIIEGPFERDSLLVVGDPRVGQITLKSAGIFEDLTTLEPGERFRAEIYVYADYIPRDITAFSFRFHTLLPDDINPAIQALPLDVDPAVVTLLSEVEMRVEIAEGGLLADDGEGTSDWRLISGDGDGRFRLVTDEENFLPFGSFGKLLKITLTNLDEYVDAFSGTRAPSVSLGMRMDNQIYISPQSERQPSETKYFLYPGGPANPERVLNVELNRADLAPPASEVALLAGLPGFDPEAAWAYDGDEDFYPDFNDPDPLDPEIPRSFIAPNSFEVAAAVEDFTLTVRNETLDRFTWSLDPSTLPTWLPIEGVRYGALEGPTPNSTLLPGESETVHFSVDRTGVTPGTAVTAQIRFSIINSEFTFFVPEIVPITLVTNP